ncbi:hypothetical protein [Bradyrhizobium sp. STM 3557]|uniref:hypothetical protein n=1 Tax=Bradyrhizobium sp. STM 3557 TaxID=578920 RepID=UPI00388EB7BD
MIETLINWALIAAQCFFAFCAVGTFVMFTTGRDYRNLLAATTFGVALAASYRMHAWWPLMAGFALLWIFRLMGLEPGGSTAR